MTRCRLARHWRRQQPTLGSEPWRLGPCAITRRLRRLLDPGCTAIELQEQGGSRLQVGAAVPVDCVNLQWQASKGGFQGKGSRAGRAERRREARAVPPPGSQDRCV